MFSEEGNLGILNDTLDFLLVYIPLLLKGPFRSFKLHCRKQSVIKVKIAHVPENQSSSNELWSTPLHGGSFALKSSTVQLQSLHLNEFLTEIQLVSNYCRIQCTIFGIWKLFILIVPPYNSTLMSQSLNQVHPHFQLITSNEITKSMEDNGSLDYQKNGIGSTRFCNSCLLILADCWTNEERFTTLTSSSLKK